jgi:hypothetical protein
MMRTIPIVAACALLSSVLPGRADAAALMPDFGTVPAGWVTDRFEPHSFTTTPGPVNGRPDVLGIEITRDEGLGVRPAGFNSTFYNTQGRQFALSGTIGDILSADLFIPAEWGDEANGHVRSDIWGVATDGSGVTGYPIIGFTNYGGARYRVWTQSGWVDPGTPVQYGDWTTFGIKLTATAFRFFINGALVYTDHDIQGSTAWQAVIMQAYNFYGDPSIAGANPVDYTARWSNTAVPEPATLILLGAGILGATSRLRRRA